MPYLLTFPNTGYGNDEDSVQIELTYNWDPKEYTKARFLPALEAELRTNTDLLLLLLLRVRLSQGVQTGDA